MTLLTKPEAERLVKQTSSVERISATMKDVQAAVAGNKEAIILLVKKQSSNNAPMFAEASLMTNVARLHFRGDREQRTVFKLVRLLLRDVQT